MSFFGSNRKGNESDLDYNRRMNEHDRIWNAAIEAVLKCIESSYSTVDYVNKIRELKK